jgi:hypothetical protein
MRLQLVLLGLAAHLTQVLGVPAAGTSDVTGKSCLLPTTSSTDLSANGEIYVAFSSVPADKALTAATGVSDSTNVPDSMWTAFICLPFSSQNAYGN